MWFLQPGITFEHVLIRILAILVIVFFSLPFHEYSHAFVANKLGDNTAKNLGLLTINPIVHFSGFGAACLLFFDFGWANPAPINPINFKNPRRDMALTALAGPCSNIISAMIGSLVINLLYKIGFLNVWLGTFATYYISINVGLAVLNMLPLPGFDGYKVLQVFIPQKFLPKYYQNQHIIFITVFLLLFLGFFSGPIDFIQRFLCGAILGVTALPFSWF